MVLRGETAPIWLDSTWFVKTELSHSRKPKASKKKKKKKRLRDRVQVGRKCVLMSQVTRENECLNTSRYPWLPNSWQCQAFCNHIQNHVLRGVGHRR